VVSRGGKERERMAPTSTTTDVETESWNRKSRRETDADVRIVVLFNPRRKRGRRARSDEAVSRLTWRAGAGRCLERPLGVVGM
jgi:hypothetical protein